MHRGRHVFIVGLSRTGTTLTRAILNTSPEIGIGGESRFLPHRALLGWAVRPGYREKFARVGDLTTDEGISRVAEHIYSHTDSQYWKRLARTLDRNVFEARLRASERTDRALLDVAMDHFASGKPIRGDKSPQHIHSVPLLLDWYPDARVVHTFRDPRGVYLSVQRKPSRDRSYSLRGAMTSLPMLSRAYSATSVIVSWRRVIALHRDYEERYPGRYMLVRFEDLVGHPAATVKRLCSFLDVDFSDQMLRQSVINSSFVARRSANGFDKDAVERWRRHLSPLTQRWFIALCRSELEEFGYEP